jgi:hypothetical protein
MVQVKIKNKTEKVVSFLPVLQTYLRDGNGVKYEITTAPNIKQAAVAGPIAPGDTVSGQIGFQVPVAVQGRLKFYYDMNAFGVHDLAIFDITPTNDKTESST